MDIHQKTAGRFQQHPQQTSNQTVKQLSKAGFPKGGRPPGSKAKVPAGYVGVAGLSEMLGLAIDTIRRLNREHPDKLPPRATWCGRSLRWSIEVVRAWQKERDGASQTQVSAPAAPPAPANSVWNFDQQISTSSLGKPAGKAKRKPGRPRKQAA